MKRLRTTIYDDLSFWIVRNGEEVEMTVNYLIAPYYPADHEGPAEGGPEILSWHPKGMPTMESHGDWDLDEQDAIIAKIRENHEQEEAA